jgi:ADP-ribosylglycohydrolase
LGVGALLLAERLGRLPEPRELAMEWMTRVSPEFQWKNGWEALRKLRSGLLPPATGQGPLGECLDARIRIEPWGLLHPGRPRSADRMAALDAGITSFGAGVDDARFTARMLASALGSAPGPGVLEALVVQSLEGLGEPFRKALLLGFESRAAGRQLEAAYAELRARTYLPIRERLSEDAWVASLPNAGLMGLALAYGEGDAVRTLRLASFLGWDSDCNAGTLGALLGALGGQRAFPEGLRASLSDRLRVAVGGEEHWSLEALAGRTRALAERLEGEKRDGDDAISQK